MKKTLFILYIILILFTFPISITFCSNKKSRITKIELATGYCHGECPFTAIKIDNALNYSFYGGRYSERKGYFKGKISRSLWDSLNNCLIKINYVNLKTKYQQTVDGQQVEIFLYYDGIVKHINTQFDALPKNVANVFHQIAISYKKVKLIPEAKRIKFSTTIQEPHISPPRFPPPNSKY